MSTQRKIAIVGAGNGGQSAAFELTQKGFTVHLQDIDKKAIEGIREREGIRATGQLEGFARIPLVTTDIAEAIEGVEAILPMVPRFAHAPVAARLASCLREDQHILLCPGSTAGELEFAKILRENGKRNPISTVATLPYAARVKEPGEVFISLVAKALFFSSFPAKEADSEARYFQAFFPALSKMTNGLEVGLNNGNPVTHPAPTLLNTARIERGEPFLFYREGITPAIARINNSLDLERLTLCRALGFREIPLTERLFLTGYADRIYASPLEAYHESEAFALIAAPKSLKDRYILEDIPYGLVTFASLADRLKLPVPTMQRIIGLASEIAAVDFWQEGMTMKALGLDRLDATHLLHFVEKGKSSLVDWAT